MVVPGSLLEVAGSPLGHGPQREDGNDSDTTGCQDRSQDPHGSGESGAPVSTLQAGDGVTDETSTHAGHED